MSTIGRSLSDDFSDPLGRWDYYDTEPTLLDELKARQHTNLRSFYSDSLEREVTMLELTQPVEDLIPVVPDTMAALEGSVTFRTPEPWTLGTIGPDPALSNRHTLRVSVPSGTVTTVSAMERGVDLRAYVTGDRLSMACPSFPGASLDLSGCSLKLEQGALSVTLPFPLGATTNANREISWPIEDLGAVLVPKKVSLTLTGTAPCVVTVAALRMLAAGWTATRLDTDTITQRLIPNINPNGSNTTTPITKVWRAGETPGPDDPRPINSRLTVSFFTGSLTAQNRITLYMRGRREDFLTQLDLDGTDDGRWGEDQDSLDARGHQPDYGQAVYNPRPQIDLDTQTQTTLEGDLQVEIERLPDTISEAWIEATLYFGSTNQVNIETTETLLDDDQGYSFSVPALTPNAAYLLGVDLEDHAMQVTIYELDEAGAVGDLIFDSTRFEDGFLFLRSRGRVGWEADLRDGDAYLESIRTRGLMFGEIRTNNLESFTPVEGARLVVGATLDREEVPAELLAGGPPNPTLAYGGATLDLDIYNTRSENGSIKVTADNHQGIQSPLLTFEDFAHSYLSFDVFYPAAALANGQNIEAYLVNQYGTMFLITMPLLKGDQWQTVRLRLTRVIAQQSGEYQLRLLQIGELTTFWIDNFKFLFQSVAWSGRATYEDPWNQRNNRWTEFQTFVNSEENGVVFPERGRWTQVRGQALTQDATIDKVYVRPKYSQLGRLVWNDPLRLYRLGDEEVINSFPVKAPPNRIAIGVSPNGVVVPEDEAAPPLHYHDAGVPLTFTGIVTTETLPIDQWHWDFGDGTESTLQNPVHTYAVATPDTIVHLRATDVRGGSVYASLDMMLAHTSPEPPPDPNQEWLSVPSRWTDFS